MISLIKIGVSLIPVFVFLAALVFLDSYKLVRPRAIWAAILAGCVVALIGMFVNKWLLTYSVVDTRDFARYVAPLIEEILKAGYMIFLIKSRRVGFMVDAAIFGFAIGAGFAFVENIYYLYALDSTNIVLWIVRGFGTAALHGATMILFGIVSKVISDSSKLGGGLEFLPGLGLAIVVHSLYNHFIIPPVWTMIMLIIVLPILIVIVYERSERFTKSWLGKGMDADIELLEMITEDRIEETPVGIYLGTLKSKFPGAVVADMLCLLRIHCELAMGAKGILLMRQAGISPASNLDIKAKFEELKYLEKSLGKTGKLAILPFLKTSSRDLWQLYMLRE